MLGENKNLVAMPARRLKMHRPSASRPFAAREVMRPVVAVARCRKGVVALEFVLVAPVLLLLIFTLFYLGIALNNYIVLTAAAEQGAQTLSLGAGTTTPYSKATTAIDNAALNLKTSQITQTVTIGGSSCSSDATCGALLNAPAGAGAVALVTLTYPCDLTFMGLSFGGQSCTLSAQTAAIVQ
jgi:Flp pilus assembly protein TadG